MKTTSTIFATLALAAGAAAFPRYVVTDVGDVPGGADASFGTDATDAGIVTAIGTGPNGSQAFVWSRAAGLVPLPGMAGRNQTVSLSINALGIVSGAVHDGTWPASYRPVLWNSSGQLTDLGLPIGVDWALQGGMNDHGVVVTWGGTANGRRALIWRPATGWEVVPPPSGFNECGFSSINNKGDICGWADDRAMLYRNGTWAALNLPAGALDAFPNYISEDGRIGGYVRMGPSLWVAGQWNLQGEFLQSPQLPGFPSMDCFGASREGGWITGAAYSNDFEKATLWSPIDGIVELNSLVDATTPGWNLQALVNTPGGLLFGWGEINGVVHACVAVPVSTPKTINVVFGRHGGGDLDSLESADGESLDVCKFIVPNQNVSPVTVEYEAECAIKSPFAYRLRSTTSTSIAGSFQQVVDLYDWQTTAYSPVDVRTDTLGTAWKTVELQGSGSLARYVGPGRTMRARIRVRPNGPVSGSAWCVRFDRIEFVAQI